MLISVETCICDREREREREREIERNSQLILSCILSQWRDSRIGVMMKFRSFGDCTSSGLQDKL